MVYCTKCGTKNEEDAIVCIKCGASLETRPFPFRRFERRRVEEECFGIPRGGTIVGLAIGIIIVFAGLMWFLQQTGYITKAVDVWPFVAIVFGILIVIGALYTLSRRR